MASAAYDNLAAKAAGNAIDLISKIYGVDNWGFGYSTSMETETWPWRLPKTGRMRLTYMGLLGS